MLLKPLAREPKPYPRLWVGPVSKRLTATLLLLLVLPVAASAYTILMRSGRRIEIPASFIVTRTTLTYEAAPGINVTLQLSSIDIAATERLNKEPGGSLLRRALERQERPASPENSSSIAPLTSAARARRTITNRDLEAVRRAREQSEEAYERRRVELGLPSLEEARKRNEEEASRLVERSRRSEEEEAQAETYWRARATELRTEFAVVDAQLDYLRNQLGQFRRPLLTGAYTIVTGVQPFVAFRPRGPLFTRPVNNFGVGAQAVGVVGFGGGSTRGMAVINPANPATNTFGRRPVFSTPRVFAPRAGLLGASYPAYDNSYDWTLMFARLHELESVRAGLDARWRLLEDEARRAGAQPGWLRP